MLLVVLDRLDPEPIFVVAHKRRLLFCVRARKVADQSDPSRSRTGHPELPVRSTATPHTCRPVYIWGSGSTDFQVVALVLHVPDTLTVQLLFTNKNNHKSEMEER